MKSVVLCVSSYSTWADPGPEATATREVQLLQDWTDEASAIVGWSDGGLVAATLAATHKDEVERLVLVATPAPMMQDGEWVGQISAKTLLLFGDADAPTGSVHARWWQTRIPNARIEMVPGGGHYILGRVWERALSHLAPGATRRGRRSPPSRPCTGRSGRFRA